MGNNTTDNAAGDRALKAGSPERFGYEWHTYSELRQEYEDQFRRWTAPLDSSEWRDRTFLDVGCGMGRNSYWPMTWGARGGVAIDVDDASLASARQTLSGAIGWRSAYLPTVSPWTARLRSSSRLASLNIFSRLRPQTVFAPSWAIRGHARTEAPFPPANAA